MGRRFPSIQVQMVYMESNHKEAEDYVRFWEDKVNRIGFSRYRSGENITGDSEKIIEMKRKGETIIPERPQKEEVKELMVALQETLSKLEQQ